MATFDKEGAIAKLKSLGVELTGNEKVADFKALLAKHDPEASKDDAGDEEGEFRVSDSNGKLMPAVYETEAEAKQAAKIYGGKVLSEKEASSLEKIK